jgi:futalosine hydrolase
VLPSLQQFLGHRALLLAVAADAEARAVLNAFGLTAAPPAWSIQHATPSIDLLVTGVGKSNAAGALARNLDPARIGAVLNVGIAGSYGPASIGSVILATASIYADEGVQASDRFIEISELGFPPADLPGMSFPGDPGLLDVLRPLADQLAPIATVSACSGQDDLARERAARTGAIAESMEGAAIAHAAHRLGVPAAELRVISNTTGDRAAQVWDLKTAFARLGSVIGRIAG